MALEAVQADALGDPVTITWRDQQFAIAAPDDWLLEFSHWAERQQITRAIEAMLGHDQYERFRATSPPPKLSEIESLITQAMSAFGLAQGE